MSIWESLTVLDLTRLLPGGYTSLHFADWGADVIKIEEPGKGDYLRNFSPKIKGMYALFHAVNRNKRSLSLDLKSESGKEIFHDLLSETDILLEGFRPGVMERLNLGYDQLQNRYPSLIYCSLTGYGQTGPKSEKVGHDLNYLCESGIMGLTGPAETYPGIAGIQIADLTGAQQAVIAIQKALLERTRSGQGNYLDVSMYDTAVSLVGGHLMEHEAYDQPPERGEELLNGGHVCYNIYSTSDDRYLCISAVEPKFWERFCEIVDRSDLVDQQFARTKPGEQPYEQIKQLFQSRTLTEWTDLLEGEEVCVSPVHTPREVLESEHFQQRELSISVPTDQTGTTVNQIRLPPQQKHDHTPDPSSYQHAPKRGEHTREILDSIGVENNRTNQLLEDQIIETP